LQLGYCQISKLPKILTAGLYDYVGSDVHHDNHIAAFSDKITLKDVVPLQEIMQKNNQFLNSGVVQWL
jgi:hypothetical protein